MRILFVSPTLSGNAVGRAYALYLLTEHLGWHAVIAGPSSGSLWAPLRGTSFEQMCFGVPTDTWMISPPIGLAEAADAVVAVKLLPQSFGVARRLARAAGKPLVLDIDDLDYEFHIRHLGLRRRLGLVRPATFRHGLHPYALPILRRAAAGTPRTVGNPELQARYGGSLVPHARLARPYGTRQVSEQPMVAFVGTVRAHKGVGLLREAVGSLADDGYRLVATAPPPTDAHPWEEWMGMTGIEEGLDIVSRSDIVAIPSLRADFAPGQLPVKLIDAMMSGRAIVAADLPPIRWALGDAGILFEPGSRETLTKALRDLRSPALRTELGERARRRALAVFTPAAVAPAFSGAVRSALSCARP